jgi:hypothetical protein
VSTGKYVAAASVLVAMTVVSLLAFAMLLLKV